MRSAANFERPMASHPSLFFVIQQVNRQVVRRIEGMLKAEGVTAGQQLVMYLLSTHAPCSSAELARRTRMTAQAMGEFLRGLEQRGLVTRSTTESGTRAILLELTPEGRELYRRCRRLMQQAEREFIGVLDEPHRQPFLDNLLTLRDAEVPDGGPEA